MLRRHWRGDTPILTALLGVGILASALMVSAGRLLLAATQQLNLTIAVASSIELAWFLFCFGVWFWAFVGIWRSAGHERPNLRYAARAAVLAGSLALAPVAIGSTQAAGELLQLASGRDPLGTPIRPRVHGTLIVVDGTLAQGSAAAFERVLNRSNSSTVRLTSAGGRIAEAERIADLIAKYGLDVEVEQLCASACTVILLAGRQRSMRPGARVGFHQSTFSGNRPADDELQSESLRTHFRRAGVHEDFIAKAFSTRSESMWYPTELEMLRAGFLTRSSIESVLQSAAEQLAPTLPRRVDSLTILRRVDVKNATLTYRYSAAISDHVSASEFNRAMQPQLHRQTCNDRTLATLVEQGAALVFDYVSASGRHLAKITITDCQIGGSS